MQSLLSASLEILLPIFQHYPDSHNIPLLDFYCLLLCNHLCVKLYYFSDLFTVICLFKIFYNWHIKSNDCLGCNYHTVNFVSEKDSLCFGDVKFTVVFKTLVMYIIYIRMLKFIILHIWQISFKFCREVLQYLYNTMWLTLPL